MSHDIENQKKTPAISSQEGGQRPTGGDEIAGAPDGLATPNPELRMSRPRRRFTASFKLQILEALDRCASSEERGSIMRREGLYSSQICEWRKARRSGALSAMNNIRGRKPSRTPEQQQIDSLQAEVSALQAQLSEAEAIIDIQKKVSEILGTKIQPKSLVGRNS